MEFFPDGLVVRLRSRIRGGLYLYARDDGLGVAVSPRRSSPNSGWEVRRFQEGTANFFILCSTATRRCLAAAGYAANQRSRRAVAVAVAVQRDYIDGPQSKRASRWRAVWAGPQYGDVVLRDIILGHKLCAEEEARYGNRVFVQQGSHGKKNKRTGTASSCHWFVEAALPLSLGPPPKPDALRCTCLCVPRLNPSTAASALLPVLGTVNQFLGYLAARNISGLRQFLDATNGGEMLQTDAALLGGEATNGQLVTGLAFVAGRSKGITTLPLHLEDQQDVGAVVHGDERGVASINDEDYVEPEAAAPVVAGDDDVGGGKNSRRRSLKRQQSRSRRSTRSRRNIAPLKLQANAEAIEHHRDHVAQQV